MESHTLGLLPRWGSVDGQVGKGVSDLKVDSTVLEMWICL